MSKHPNLLSLCYSHEVFFTFHAEVLQNYRTASFRWTRQRCSMQAEVGTVTCTPNAEPELSWFAPKQKHSCVHQLLLTWNSSAPSEPAVQAAASSHPLCRGLSCSQVPSTAFWGKQNHTQQLQRQQVRSWPMSTMGECHGAQCMSSHLAVPASSQQWDQTLVSVQLLPD